VIWDERIFMTTALENGKQRVVFCLDRNNGTLLWQQIAWTGEPEKSHIMNGWASATCVTDGKLVFAFFGIGGLHCYTVDGKHVWSRDLGHFKSPWGVSACPVLVGDVLIQNGDSEEDAFIMGLDKKTGETLWKTARPNERGWSTPILITANGRQEVVVNGHRGVTAYDPATGKELWFCKSFNGRGEPTVTPAAGLLCVVNGLAGDVYAIKPGGNGDVTKTHMAWHTPRKEGRDLPSPIVVDRYLVVCSMSGIMTCYDATNGEQLWKERLDGRFSSSPIAAGGHAYFQSEAGVTYVVKPGPTYQLVAENKLAPADEEIFRASLSVSEGQIFSRSDHVLYCIGKRKPSAQ
jgi:outer membrane protein assembly factor BamB